MAPARGRSAPKAWEQAASEAHDCRRCPLWKPATQTVFGEGPVPAPLMLVGEQPGDQEDQQGHPFVGPAGHVLDRALEAAGIARADTYLTNAVKHFKWTPRGKRRIHQKPDRSEVEACAPWFAVELDLVAPDVLVFLGATAAQSQLGSSFRVTRDRGRPLDSDLAPVVLATVHPSSILRGPPDQREQATAALVADLRVAAELLPPGSSPNLAGT